MGPHWSPRILDNQSRHMLVYRMHIQGYCGPSFEGLLLLGSTS